MVDLRSRLPARDAPLAIALQDPGADGRAQPSSGLVVAAGQQVRDPGADRVLDIELADAAVADDPAPVPDGAGGLGAQL
jgi:hypothetical protein